MCHYFFFIFLDIALATALGSFGFLAINFLAVPFFLAGGLPLLEP
jgi:hypothetical protein